MAIVKFPDIQIRIRICATIINTQRDISDPTVFKTIVKPFLYEFAPIKGNYSNFKFAIIKYYHTVILPIFVIC